jgi:hypothetical protein
MFERLQRLGGPRGDPDEAYQVEFRKEGFRLFRGESRELVATVRRAEVTEVRTYKLDVFSYDVICLLFASQNGTNVEITEGMRGFEAIFNWIERIFSSVPDDWYNTVMIPTFATNERVLYRRGDDVTRRE